MRRSSSARTKQDKNMTKWQSVGDGIWVYVYVFNGNPINCTAIAIGNGNLAVVSPATNLDPRDYDELTTHGKVSALVSPGAYHNMGLPAWSARFPEAGIYGPGPAAAHIARQHPSLPPLKDFTALAKLLPQEVEVFEVDGCAQPDVLIVVRRPDATTWLTNEIITNWKGWPKSLIFRILFKLTGSGPGLDVSKMSLMFLKGKKAIVRAYFEAKVASHPPTRLIPCHGEILHDPHLATKIAETLARRL
jgi:hypothetical protein